jgi:hypothetical protein
MVLEPASGKRPRALTDFIDESRVRFGKMEKWKNENRSICHPSFRVSPQGCTPAPDY